MGMLKMEIQDTTMWVELTVRGGLMIVWAFQFDTHICPLPSFGFARPQGAAATTAADAVLQQGDEGEGVSLVRRPGRRQTLHACVIVLCGLILLHNTGKAARVGGGAGEVMTLGDGRGPATEIRTTPWVITLQHSPT